MKSYRNLAIAMLTLAASIAPATAHAANGGQALEIGPTVLNLTANPGQTINTKLSIRDVSTQGLVVTGQVNDFVANGEDGTPKVLLDDTTDNPYSIKSWLSNLPVLTLKSRQIKDLPITIKVPSSAAPGGYYGIVRFTGTAPNFDGTGVGLNASLGSLIFIKVNGDAKESINIEEFSINNGGNSNTLFENTPLNFVQRIKNTGNTYEQPTGLVTVSDMFNNTVATLPVNGPQNIILAQSIRKFSEPLDTSVIGNRVLFGMYHAHLSMKYGVNQTETTKDVTFWIIPYKLIAFGLIILVALFFLVRFLIKRYNRAIINRSSGRRRRR